MPDKTSIVDIPLPNANRSILSQPGKVKVLATTDSGERCPREKINDENANTFMHSAGLVAFHGLSRMTIRRHAERDILNLPARMSGRSSLKSFRLYFRKRRLSWDRFVLSIAESAGLTIFPGGDPRNNIRTSAAPMLWHDTEEPDPAWCRLNDWWLPRGTQNIHIFDFIEQEFVTVVPKSGVDYPVIAFLGSR